MNKSRVLFSAPSSGSGKTMICCGILQALFERGLKVASFKCGPDYIDPMFHEKVIGVSSANLDLFFLDEKKLRSSFIRNSGDADISVIEGVMGYYDGLSAASDEASSYRVAEALDAPVILIIDARAQSLSALAILKGFKEFRSNSNIQGVIFNRMSPKIYEALKAEVENCGIKPLGYVPKAEDMVIESRHLGLVTPNEISDMSERLHRLAELLEETLDIDEIIKIAQAAPKLEAVSPTGKAIQEQEFPQKPKRLQDVKIAVAKDEAFCFIYKDNLRLLEAFGARLKFFSPLKDEKLPEGTQGILLPGGYPELYAKRLSENSAMRKAVADAVKGGMPCLAECGGFIYLHRELADMEGEYYPMCGVINAAARKGDRLGKFGYITLKPLRDNEYLRMGESIKGHEFHYYESESCGEAFKAIKPDNARQWTCIHAEGNLFAGLPHLFYESNPKLIERFVAKCAERGSLNG
jgi:cobyrinic acid a,c-diamide synthase